MWPSTYDDRTGGNVRVRHSRRVAVVAATAATLLTAACGSAATQIPAPDTVHAAVGVGPAKPSPTPTDPAVDADLQAVLDEVAAAFLAHQPDGVRAHLHDPDSPFGRRWTARAENLREVPLARYAFDLDESFPDLATHKVRERYDRDVVVRYVLEEHELEAFDPSGPVVEDVFLTFVRHDDGWKVAGDTDGEALGLVSADHLWDFGPVTTTRSGDILALHHPGGRDLAPVVAEAAAAVHEVRESWPLDWPTQVAMLVPRDEAELAELLHVTFDLSNFIAFATATPDGELGEYRLTGSRIVLNPDRFLNRSSATRRSILAHELLHVASRPAAGPMTPSWVEEGLAQRIGEGRSTTGLGLLESQLASGSFVAALPDDSDFVTGGRDRIFLSYQLSFSFLDHLVDTYGVPTVASWYDELGRGSVGEPGRESYHVRRSLEQVFGVPFEQLRAAWAARLTAGG